MKRHGILTKCVWIVAGTSLFAHAALARTYVVRSGDVLSRIARRELGPPIYGKKGSLNQLLKINSKIYNPNYIRVGQTIEILDTQVAPQPISTLPVEKEKEVIRNPQSENTVDAPEATLATTAVEEQVQPNVAPELPVEPSFQQYNLLSFSPTFSYLKVNGSANGNTSTLISDLNYGGDFSWNQMWSEKFHSFLSLGFSEVQIQQASNRTISNANQIYSRINAGGEYQLSQKVAVGGSLGTQSQIFYHSSSVTDLTIDKVFIPQANVWGKWDFYQLGQFTTGTSLQGGLLLPSSTSTYTISMGYNYRTTLYLRQELPSQTVRLQGGLYYGQSIQNTSISNLSTSEVGIIFGLSWAFGQGNQKN